MRPVSPTGLARGDGDQPAKESKRGSGVRKMMFPGASQLARQVLLRGGVAIFCLLLTAALVYLGRNGYSDSQNPVNRSPCLMRSASRRSHYQPRAAATSFRQQMPTGSLARPDHHAASWSSSSSRWKHPRSLDQAYHRAVPRKRWRNNVHDHTIIVGYGVKGRSATQALIDNGTPPNQIVVISPDERDQGRDRHRLRRDRGRRARDDVPSAPQCRRQHARSSRPTPTTKQS